MSLPGAILTLLWVFDGVLILGVHRFSAPAWAVWFVDAELVPGVTPAMVLVLGLFPISLGWRITRRWRPPFGCCQTCGYDLRASPEQ